MKAQDQRINVHRGGRLEIVALFASWQRWQAACSAASAKQSPARGGRMAAHRKRAEGWDSDHRLG